MPRVSEETLNNWRKRPSDTEDERHRWTRRKIREALDSWHFADDASFDIYAKGSYPNHTNVRLDSDVDVAAELTSIVKHQFSGEAEGLGLADIGVHPRRSSPEASVAC